MESALSDTTLRSIASRLGHEWKTLASHLGIRADEVDRIEADYLTTEEMIFRMLLKWQQRLDGASDASLTLCKALESCGRTDVTYILQDGRGEDFNLGLCRKEFIRYYKDTMGQLPLNPLLTTDYSWMMDMFVDLTLEKNERKGASVPQHEIHYEDILQLLRKDQQEVRDIILSGDAGSGKTTIASKMAYDWSLQDPASPLSKFPLLVALNLRELESTSDLTEAIFDQIIPKDIQVSRGGLKNYLKTHGHDVLMILDGVDELGSQLPTVGDIIDVIRRRILRDCTLIVTTRPHMVDKLCGLNPRFTHVKSKGFADEAILKYIESFFQVEVDEVSQQLYQFLIRSPVHHELARLPLMLLVMCLIWSDDRKLPDTLTGFFKEAVFFIINRHLVKSEQPGSYDEDMYWKKIRNDLVKDVGKVALDGLLLPGQKLVFERTEFGNDRAIENACKIGILSQERVRSKLRAVQKVTFIHKTFQEAFAGFYLASLAESDERSFAQYVDQIHKRDIDSLEYLLRFCSGASVKAARMLLTRIVRLTYCSQFNEDTFSTFLQIHLEAGSEELYTIAKPLFEKHGLEFSFYYSDWLNSAFKYLIDCACKSPISCRDKTESFWSMKRINLFGVTVKGWPVVTSILGNAVNVSDLNLRLSDHGFAEAKTDQTQLYEAIHQMKSLQKFTIHDVTVNDWPLITSILGNTVNVSDLNLSLKQSFTERKQVEAQLFDATRPMKSLQKLSIGGVTVNDWPLVTSILGNAVNVSDLDLSLDECDLGIIIDQAQILQTIRPMKSLQKVAIRSVHDVNDWPFVTSILGNAVNVSDLDLILHELHAEEETDQTQLVEAIHQMKSLQKLTFRGVTENDWYVVTSILGNAVNVSDLDLSLRESLVIFLQLFDPVRPMMSLQKLAIHGVTVFEWSIVYSILNNAVNVSDLHLSLNQGTWSPTIEDRANCSKAIGPLTSLQKLAIHGVTVNNWPFVTSILGNAVNVSDLDLGLDIPVSEFLSTKGNEEQAHLFEAIRQIKSLQNFCSVGSLSVIAQSLANSASTSSLRTLVSRDVQLFLPWREMRMHREVTMYEPRRDECHGGKFLGSDQQLRFLKIEQGCTQTFLSSTGKILSKAPHLQGVLLSGHNIGGAITEITKPLSQLKDLKELELDELGLTAEHAVLLLNEVLPFLTNLQFLSLSYNKLSPEALLDVIQWSHSSSSLRVLKLLECAKDKPPPKASGLTAATNLIDLPPKRIRKTEGSLEVLDIHGNYLGKHTSRLIELLSGIHTLKEVNMEDMGLTNSDAVNLADALKDCHQLQQLHLEGNNDVGDQGVEYLFRMLGDKPGIQSHPLANAYWLNVHQA